MTLKVVTDDTEGRCSVIEHRLAAHSDGPPVHVHDQLDHAVYVLEGTVVLTVEQRRLTAPAGSFALIRHGIAHTFANPSEAVVRFVEVDAPAGFERYLSAWPRPLLPGARSIPPLWWPSRPSTTPTPTRRTLDPRSPPGQVRSARSRQRAPPAPCGGLVDWSRGDGA